MANDIDKITVSLWPVFA